MRVGMYGIMSVAAAENCSARKSLRARNAWQRTTSHPTKLTRGRTFTHRPNRSSASRRYQRKSAAGRRHDSCSDLEDQAATICQIYSVGPVGGGFEKARRDPEKKEIHPSHRTPYTC